MTPINIEALSQDKTEYGLKVTLVDGRKKYVFYNTKKDGSETVAFQQFNQFGFKIGDVVQAEVKEEEKTFNDKKTGKPVTYTDRRIMYFETLNDTTPVVRNTPSSTPSGDVALAKQVSGLVSKLHALENRIGELELKLAGDSIGATAEALNF